MALSKDTREDINFLLFIIAIVAFALGIVFGIGYLGYINGKFDGACEYAGGSVTDNLCIDGDTVLFTYDNWSE